MFDAFKKWTMSGHTFSFVKLTAAEVESLGAATRQFLEPDRERGGAPMVRKNARSQNIYGFRELYSHSSS